MQDIFEPHGELFGVLFTKRPAKNYGFVYFEGPKKEKHARKAMKALNGAKLKGCPIRCGVRRTATVHVGMLGVVGLLRH